MTFNPLSNEKLKLTGVQYHTFIGSEDFELPLMTIGTTSGVKVL